MKTTKKINTVIKLFFVLNLLVYSSSYAQKTKANDIYKNIEFTSQDAILRGRLYLPTDKSGESPVVIMAHGFTTTINGMTAEKYAEKFREAGFAVLLYDHRNLGSSDGEPRQEINYWVQTRGYIDCINYALTQPEIDTKRIAVWGCSLSATEAFLVGCIDERVKAIVALVPGFGKDIPKEKQNDKIYTFAKDVVLSEKIRDISHTTMEQIPVVTDEPIGSPAAIELLTAYRWFIEYGGRLGTNWKNLVSWSDIDRPQGYHDIHLAPYLKAPILMIIAHDDEMPHSNAEVAHEVYKRINQPKELLDINGGHFGLLYYPSELFDKSSQTQINFLNKYLR